MAQAARLNLRMQKELKLLMTNPPPGVSIPLLSDNGSSSSLSTIEAQIEGPEGTVYSKGIFTIKIQIPERYPFQPPNGTFVTPIYHPNIDTGGRICLDILNMPPKGAWQPSLNISTILTSIGLLLSEPNPDDGLMAETSKEYKYNRQAFDQKARAWTQKYANGEDIERSKAHSSSDQNPSPELEIEPKKADLGLDNNAADINRKKLRLSGEKLSLKSKLPVEMDNKEKENAPTNRKLSLFGLTQKTTVVNNTPNSLISEQYKSDTNEDKQVADDAKEIESTIVSDSEESDEDQKPRMSRMSVMRKKLLGKSGQFMSRKL